MITSLKHNAIDTGSTLFDPFFLHKGEAGEQAFSVQVDVVKEKLAKIYKEAEAPYAGKSPDEIKHSLASMLNFSEESRTLSEVLDELEDPVLTNSLHISHEKSLAHLHCPPLITGIVAELIIGALNQSMDSWDQSPSATYVEEELIRQLAQLAQLPDTADGVFTSGGTQSNYMGLLLARDAFCQSHWGHDVQAYGLPNQLQRMRVLCSEDVHFSVMKSASQLGLGEQAVLPIPTDADHKMSMPHVRETIKQLEEDDLLPFAMVATCGTTDYGSIDPLNELANVCREKELWLHVDAAYGGGLLFSHSYEHKIAGLHHADSVTLDFHKLCYQPISCGLFLVRDRHQFRLLSHHADYLNPKEDEEDGIVNLVNKSVQTTRRFDALKVLLTLKTVGTHLLGSMIDHTIELAQYTAYELTKRPDFVVENDHPELTTVVFQYQPANSMTCNELNRSIQQTLFHDGQAIIAKTSVNGKTYLKFTLLNPRTTKEDIQAVIHEIERIGSELMNGGFQK